MKKVLYIMFSLLQAALLVGSYIVNYFTQKKLGMLRWVIFMNRSWEAEYPVDVIKIVIVTIVTTLTILLLISFIKKKEVLTTDIKISNMIMTVLSFIYIGFTMFLSTDKLKAYYFISLMIGLATLIQILKVFMKLVVLKHEK